jgi:hypothetical protein
MLTDDSSVFAPCLASCVQHVHLHVTMVLSRPNVAVQDLAAWAPTSAPSSHSNTTPVFFNTTCNMLGLRATLSPTICWPGGVQ